MSQGLPSGLLVVCWLALLFPTATAHMYCGDNNCYTLLGVEQTASEIEIKRAYRTLAKKYHPDKNKGDGQAEAAAMFVQIAEAYEILSDDDLRQNYNYALQHPEETIRNQFRYYRARYKPQVPVSWVLLGVALVSFVIECTAIHTAAQRKKRNFRLLSNTVGEARLRIKATKEFQASRKKISQTEINKEVDCMIRELQHKGYFAPFSLKQTSIYKIPLALWKFVVSIPAALKNNSSKATKDAEDTLIAEKPQPKPSCQYPLDVVYPRMQFRQKLKMEDPTKDAAPEQRTQKPTQEQNSSAWTKEDSGHLSRALIKYPGGTRGRWAAVARTMNNKTGRCEDSGFYIAHARKIQQQRQRNKQQKEQSKSSTQRRRQVSPDKASSNNSGLNAAGHWTASQQKQLETAIASAVGITSPKERWKYIGTQVDGKSAKECVQRFRDIRASLKAPPQK